MSSTTEYALNAVAWSALGFLAGYGTKDLISDITGHWKNQMPESHKHLAELPIRSRMTHGMRAAIKSWDATRTLGIILLLLALLSVVATYQQNKKSDQLALKAATLASQQKALVQCVAQFANAQADALDARTIASTEQQAALDELFNAIPLQKTATSGEDFVKAFHKYQAVRAKQIATITRNPYPPAPRKVCEGL